MRLKSRSPILLPTVCMATTCRTPFDYPPRSRSRHQFDRGIF